MPKISGVVKEIMRVSVPCPKDGIHRASKKDGAMKGCRSVLLNGKTLIPHGMTGFYIRHKKEYGIKVFFSLAHNRTVGLRTIRKEFAKYRKLYRIGVCVKPEKIVRVALDFDYYGKSGKKEYHAKKVAYGIKVQHCHYPKRVWHDYARGYPYDFKGCRHPRHTAKEYLKFLEWMRPRLVAAKTYICGDWPVKETENPKLGDIAFCTKKGRWYAVDVG